MSNTYRTLPQTRFYYRRPKTAQEIRENVGLLNDLKIDDELPQISGVNRMRRYIPVSWDDIPISAYYEGDFKK